MKLVVMVGVGVVVAGCSGANAGSGSVSEGATTKEAPGCAERSGQYLVTFRERSGTCGAISEQIVTFGSSAAAASTSQCTSDGSASADGCKVTFALTCPSPDLGKGAKSVSQGTATWSADGLSGTSLSQLALYEPNGSLACQSTYDLTYKHQ